MQLIGSSEIAIAAPPARVWAALEDVAGWRTWMPGIRWAVLEGAFEAGAYVTLVPERGRRQTAYRIDVADAPATFALGITFGPVAALRRSWSVSADGTGSRVTYTVEIAGPLRSLLARKTAEHSHAAGPAMLAALRSACVTPSIVEGQPRA
jgi:carbon monoxide dehydrogenase subunit G